MAFLICVDCGPPRYTQSARKECAQGAASDAVTSVEVRALSKGGAGSAREEGQRAAEASARDLHPQPGCTLFALQQPTSNFNFQFQTFLNGNYSLSNLPNGAVKREPGATTVGSPPRGLDPTSSV